MPSRRTESGKGGAKRMKSSIREGRPVRYTSPVTLADTSLTRPVGSSPNPGTIQPPS
jgi:hypothetical protein